MERDREGNVEHGPSSDPTRDRARTNTLAAEAGELVPEDRERLIGRFGRKFLAGEAIFREGEPAREAFLLQDGRVRLLKRVRMVERSLLLLKPG
ncbi:MAG: hypothetical protein JWM74_1070, partial [Myxococcaceae bacterium]|nr:hypothetical protein [Myxococcaceae bacterium]